MTGLARRKFFAGAGRVLAGGTILWLARPAWGAGPMPAQACARTGAAVPGIAAIAEETAGPFALHSLLDDPAIVRRDIAHRLQGVPLQIQLRLLDVDNGGAPMADAGVYVWHCDKDGRYSGYGDAIGERFCRGLQFSDCDGRVRLRSIFPGWYPGRVTHVHFQVYLTASGRLTATSQFAFPDEVVRAAHATEPYSARGQNPMHVSEDGVFGDGVAQQLARVEGNPRDGLSARLDVGIRRR